MALEESILPFQCPRLIYRVQGRLAVISDRFSVTIDDDGRVVVLGTRRPYGGNIDPFGVPDDDIRVVLQCRGPGPKGTDTRARGLKVWGDVLQRFEVVAW